LDKNSSNYGENEDDDVEDEGIDDDEVVYSLMDDKSGMNFVVFGAMPVQTMHDPYTKKFSALVGMQRTNSI
jgi:hypothetical protein